MTDTTTNPAQRTLPPGKRHPITSVESQVFIDSGELPDADTPPLFAVLVDLSDDESRHKCSDCGERWLAVSLNPVDMLAFNLSDRNQPGAPIPSGECPNCGCLCYPDPEGDAAEQGEACPHCDGHGDEPGAPLDVTGPALCSHCGGSGLRAGVTPPAPSLGDVLSELRAALEALDDADLSDDDSRDECRMHVGAAISSVEQMRQLVAPASVNGWRTYLVTEVVQYRVQAASADHAEQIVTEADEDERGLHFVAVTDRTAVEE